MNSSPCRSIICAIRRHSTMSMPVPRMAIGWWLGAGDWRLGSWASQYEYGSNCGRNDRQGINTPKRRVLRCRFIYEKLARRPGGLWPEYCDLGRLLPCLVPLSAEIEVEPSVFGQYGDD